MKVILAGISKTGTKSMVLALKGLGFNVHDYLEHYLYNRDAWLKICYDGGSIEEFREMYQGVDAVADSPAWYFWEELHLAFPDAKIILTVRDSEDQWYQSMKRQVETFQTPLMFLMRFLSPTYRRFYNYGLVLGTTVFGIYHRSIFGDPTNELLLKMAYRRHNTYVIETAPKDKLFVFNVKEGWAPLCQFLGLEVPDKPFPHENVAGNITKKMMSTHPFFIRMQREMILSLLVLGTFLLYGCYKFTPSFNLFKDIFSKKLRPLLM